MEDQKCTTGFEEYKEYKYNSSAGQWVELPFDQPANDFVGRLKKADKAWNQINYGFSR